MGIWTGASRSNGRNGKRAGRLGPVQARGQAVQTLTRVEPRDSKPVAGHREISRPAAVLAAGRTSALLAARAVFDAVRGLGHLVLDRVAQQFSGGDDVGRDEGEQKRIFDRRNATLVVPKVAQKLTHCLISPDWYPTLNSRLPKRKCEETLY